MHLFTNLLSTMVDFQAVLCIIRISTRVDISFARLNIYP